jgi:Flp pilus assembly protein TadD
VRTRTIALVAGIGLTAAAAGADVSGPSPSANPSEAVKRAEVQVARESWDAAVAAYKEAIVANPEDAALHNRLGICYQRMGDAKTARKAYKKAIDLRADYAEVWNNLGTLDHARGKYKQAISAYSKAIRLDPRTAVFYSNLGAAWLARGDVPEGARGLERSAYGSTRDLREQGHRGRGRSRISPASTTSTRRCWPRAEDTGRRFSTCPRRSAWASGTSRGSRTIGTSRRSSSTRATPR